MDRIGAVTRAWPAAFPAGGQPRLTSGDPASAEKPADPRPPQDTQTTTSEAGTAASSPSAKTPHPPQLQDAKTAALVSQLVQRDHQVRAHEAAHIEVGGMYVRGGARFSYTTGPDGQAYATGGEVSIDPSPVPDNPQATIQKLQQVQRAALAPADPSPQDRTVAAAAAMGTLQAQVELVQGQLNAYRTTANSTNSSSTRLSVTV